MGGGYVACVAWVGLCWGDTTVAAAHRHPVACVACGVSGVVAGVVPEVVAAEVCPPNQRRNWQ